MAAPQVRRFDYDVTNTVNVSCVDAVREATRDLFYTTWPGVGFDELWLAFHDFELATRAAIRSITTFSTPSI